MAKSSAFETDPELIKSIHTRAGASLGKSFHDILEHNARVQADALAAKEHAKFLKTLRPVPNVEKLGAFIREQGISPEESAKLASAMHAWLKAQPVPAIGNAAEKRTTRSAAKTGIRNDHS